MPTAARRAKQKQAKAKAEAESEANKTARRTASKSTQTGLEAEAVYQIVQNESEVLADAGLQRLRWCTAEIPVHSEPAVHITFKSGIDIGNILDETNSAHTRRR